MKKLFYMTIIAALLTACDIDNAGNGGIYGNWQLQQVDTLASGGMRDMSKSCIYWAFESDVMQIRRIDGNNIKLMFTYKAAGDSITVRNPLLVRTKDELIAVEDKKTLEEYCMTGLTDIFHIIRKKNNTLILENSAYRMTFRKY